MQIRRAFSLYSNKLYIEAINSVQSRNIPKAISLFEQVKQDPSCSSNINSFSRVAEYLKTCYLTTREFGKLSTVLEELLMLSTEKKFNEEKSLVILKNLYKSYIDSGKYDKALFITESYERILRKRHFSEYFLIEMELMKANAYFLTNKYEQSRKTAVKLLEKELDSFNTGSSLNVVAMSNFLNKEGSSEEQIKLMKEALYHLELNTYVKIKDIPIKLEDEEANKEVQVYSEESDIQNADIHTYKTFKHRSELHFLEYLNELLEKESLTAEDLLEYKLKSKYSLVPIGNLAEILRKNDNSSLAIPWNKFGLDHSTQLDISFYTRFAFNIYNIYDKAGNVNLAENFLLSALQVAKINDYEYEKLCRHCYMDLLKKNKRNYELYHFTKQYFQETQKDYDITSPVEIDVKNDVNVQRLMKYSVVVPDYSLKIE